MRGSNFEQYQELYRKMEEVSNSSMIKIKEVTVRQNRRNDAKFDRIFIKTEFDQTSSKVPLLWYTQDLS